MKKVLVVEDNKMVGLMLSKRLEGAGYDVDWAMTLKDARDLLDKTDKSYFAALLDYSLPDAPNGEVIPWVVERGIPVIVFTGLVDEKVRENVWSQSVVDYVLKEDTQGIPYILTLLHRLEMNEKVKVLVVDESVFFRKALVDLLNVHRYQCFTASNGKEALDICNANPDIQLVITDFKMPKMDGLELTQKLRKNFSGEQMAIIAMSSEGESLMAARFIKSGANDFLVKQSFITEEFYSRVTRNINYLEQVERIREAAIRDYLTGLYNRRYFFGTGETLFANAKRENITLVCAMLDIDFFKKVNDTYGHDSGDLVLKHVADTLQRRMRKTDIVARLGGEEFCILAANMKNEAVHDVFNNLRTMLEESEIVNDDGEVIRITMSFGVVTELENTLDETVKLADKLLYQAKKGGRNRVVIDYTQ